jgi:hypothetical protein
MDENTTMKKPWSLVIPSELWLQLRAHLFPGDGDEHGAVITAGIAESERGVRLLGRDLFLARDGSDYVPGQRGYRMLTANFVRDHAIYCREENLAYLAVHNHGGYDRVGFSADDLASHERGYPALLDIIGAPVGALVFAENAVAGDIWISNNSRTQLTSARIIGSQIWEITPSPVRTEKRSHTYDRQARLFGDRGQQILSKQKVGIVGAGGVGSLLIEYLSRLGVNHIVIADPQRIETSNIPRVVGSKPSDALPWHTHPNRPNWLRRIGMRLSTRKVSIARRVALCGNPNMLLEHIYGDFLDPKVVSRFKDCDYLFLAADSMQARLLFNAVVHQYLIPGVQVGSKVSVDAKTGAVLNVFSVVRPVSPGQGCLWCNGLISPHRLQEEALSNAERTDQRYVDEPEVIAPSVITLNSVAASHAANDYLFRVTSLRNQNTTDDYVYFEPMTRNVRFEQPRIDKACIECGLEPRSRRARGDGAPLPTRNNE